jgi:hypothetical protein
VGARGDNPRRRAGLAVPTTTTTTPPPDGRARAPSSARGDHRMSILDMSLIGGVVLLIVLIVMRQKTR